MTQWYVAAKKADFDKIAMQYKIDPVIARIMRNRDIIEAEDIENYLYPSINKMHSPFLLKDMQRAISIIRYKIAEGKKIRIIGDYDIDGVCSTYILKKGLIFLGARVDEAIPHRIKDGYGINEQLIQDAYQESVDTIITCDNGISAIDPISYAKQLGMTVIVTDHHEVPYQEIENKKIYTVLEADAIVNPKQEECKYPFKGICGGMVAFKVIQALLEEVQSEEKKCLMEELVEIAAFATVGDVMELKDENRIIVKQGLALMQHTKNLGLQALIEVNALEGKRITPYHLGYVFGPCLNASGRLDSAIKALQLFEAGDRTRAVQLAGDLKALNDSRKELTKKGVEEAIKQIEEEHRSKDKIFVLYLPDCHESLAGIIAGRIKEYYGKPTFVLTKGEEGVKGSGRSIEAFHMYEEMNRCKELFLKYGGHKLAAGLTMKEENIEKLREALNNGCTLSEKDFETKIHIDVPMPISYITKELINQLEILEPFGTGNEKPVFAQKEVIFLKEIIIGKQRSIAKFVITDESGKRVNMIFFGDLDKFHHYIKETYGENQLTALQSGKTEGFTLSIIYYPTINAFRGSEEIQLVMEDYR